MKENTIIPKKNLNNKLKNLSTAWTGKKIVSLLLLTFLQANEIKAGQAFKNCLMHGKSDTTSYQALINYNFSGSNAVNPATGDIYDVCCSGLQCFTLNSSCITNQFSCGRINKKVFCCNYPRENSCGGIIGDSINALILGLDKIALGECQNYNLDNTINYLKVASTSSSDSFTGIDKGYANLICNSPGPCSDNNTDAPLYCYWDNYGWTCQTPDGTCKFQWFANFPNPVSSSVLTTSFTSSSLVLSSSTFLSNSPSKNYVSSHNLTKKIAIPAGTVVGVATASGVVYYLYKEHKKRKKQQSGNQDSNSQLFELASTSQPTIRSGDTGQPILTSTTTEPEEQPHSTSLGMPVDWESSTPTEEAINNDKKELQLGKVVTKPTEREELQTQQSVPPKK